MSNVSRKSTSRGLIAVIVTLFVVIAGPVSAQSWFDRLKDSVGLGENTGELSQSTLIDGLREALRLGSERVVAQLGQEGGFSADPVVRIPLPESLRRAQSLLERAGLGDYGEDLALRLNRAAEAAVLEARDVFVESIRQMSIADAREIVTGADDAATQYFRRTMTPELRERIRPLIDSALSEVGAVQIYRRFTRQYESLPLVPDLQADLADHTLDKTLDGVFHYMAREEAAIRNDPARRTTDLLKQVFGGG
ncbi:MAG: DUF4197 domain-containing protein [Wenzhouxiangellaceae bacterium]